jgi:hypothetical protein
VRAAAPPQPKKRNDDLPDVSLQVPEDARPELKAILVAQALDLVSKNARDRIKAASVLGGLGEQAGPARGVLCRAMLDPNPAVRVASADALKSIDPKIHFLAVALLVDRDSAQAGKRLAVLKQIQALKDDGWPLAALVAVDARGRAAALAAIVAVDARGRVRAARTGGDETALLIADLKALGAIARKDLAGARLVAAALGSGSAEIRHAAIVALRDMKHGKLALRRILALLRVESAANRAAAIETVAALADESTEEMIAAAVAGQRYHESEAVRRAVEVALNKLRVESLKRESKEK